jgi:PAS domain-containing protein
MALTNMSQGLCLYDADERIVIANDLYAELYDLDPEQTKSGTSLTDVVAARVAAGTCEFTSSEEFFLKRTERLAAASRTACTSWRREPRPSS